MELKSFKENFEEFVDKSMKMGLPLSELKVIRQTKKEIEFLEPNYRFRILAVRKNGRWYFRIATSE